MVPVARIMTRQSVEAVMLGIELEPRVGPSKVGVEKYHAWGGTLAILGVSRGCFWPLEPTQYPRGAWGFS